MDYHIAFSPDIELEPADFVAAWNDDTEAHSQASASLSLLSSAHYDATILTEVFLSVTTGVVGNALYELIKKILLKKGVRKHTHIEELKTPDGTHMLIVDIDEK
jgi:hypothetical protein